MVSSPCSVYKASLPQKVCFRVTRFCNARCGFCLAPPDGGVHPPAVQLTRYIDWLLDNGVTSIHFCGGEPTIHHDLPQLIEHVHAQGKKPRLTSNGISMSDGLIATLYNCKTDVKISLHGPKDFHNAMMGREAFDAAAATIARLQAAGVHTSIQTTIVHGHLDKADWIIQYALEQKVRRVCFLPFIPRGNGHERRGIYELSYSERRTLQTLVKDRRKKFNGMLDIKLLDFNVKQVPVVEPDGRVIMESSTEAQDVVLYQIPATPNRFGN